jgi:uncharacterized membrane protein
MRELVNLYLFHWTPDRAIWLGGQTLWWDARCAGIYIGFGLAVLCHLQLARSAEKLPTSRDLLLGTFFAIPLLLDVVSVQQGLRAPSNDARYITGLLFGSAFALYVLSAFVVLVRIRSDHVSPWNRRRFFLVPCVITVVGSVLAQWDSVVTYVLLQVFAVFGCVSLLSVLSIGTFAVAEHRARGLVTLVFLVAARLASRRSARRGA